MKIYYRKGMTLVELMCVVGIIVLLSGIMAYFVSGNRANNAQMDMINDVAGLMNAQRSRAMGLNVAAYITIDGDSIQPKLGDSSACIIDDAAQYPIRYNNVDNDEVKIRFSGNAGGKHSTLDSIDSNKYFNGVNALVNVSFAAVDASNNAVALTGAALTACFQPNGRVYFINNNAFINADWVSVNITPVRTGAQTMQVRLSSFGTVNRANP